MAEALGMAGFEVIECRARFLPYTTKSRLPKWPVLVRLYLALRPAQWLFGKQMLRRRPATGLTRGLGDPPRGRGRGAGVGAGRSACHQSMVRCDCCDSSPRTCNGPAS